MVRAVISVLVLAGALSAGTVDLKDAVVVVRPQNQIAATVLVEEIEKRTGIRLQTSTSWPKEKPVVAITTVTDAAAWDHPVPSQREQRPEGYRLLLEDRMAPVVWILGADSRGALFGVGYLLRMLDWSKGQIRLEGPVDLSTAPVQRIRGHQLGYRAQANSYDAWSVAQFEQYIRELTFFGVNSIESIPFQDDRTTPVMKVQRREMNRAIGEICGRYGLDHWAWIPADFDLADDKLRSQMMKKISEFVTDSPELTGIFVPGGDPGHNPPELVLPFLEDMAKQTLATHPKARIWLSLQWFTPKQVDFIYDYLRREKPAWFGGLVGGPSSPPLAQTRERLPKPYLLRDYPDITHNKLSQYPVPFWDQAFALTLGREAINPRPVEFAAIHARVASLSDGFISYSDGAHDDVNKIVWSALSWDPEREVRDILTEYARVYFHPRVAGSATDGILALEHNWRGSLIENRGVDQTLQMWQEMDRQEPGLRGNWRWQMCLLRANYDAYIRARLLNETALEEQANAALLTAAADGPETAMSKAAGILNRAITQPTAPELRARIVELCEQLYQSIGLQTSVEKYYAINAQRGAVLDFADYPMNNRWWLEDEFVRIRTLASQREKTDALEAIARWEHPGPGSFYDNPGNFRKSPNVVPGDSHSTFWWWDQGKSRARLTWQVTMWPSKIFYEGLDPSASYVLRTTGFGQALPRANGEPLKANVKGNKMGEFKEFPIPAALLKDRTLVVTWDLPVGEDHLNWRDKSRLSEVWLLRH